MLVLKFGGSSVANAQALENVISIIKNAIQKDKIIVVVSALGGMTDTLLKTALKAAEGNEDYKSDLKIIEERHLGMVTELLPPSQQSSTLSLVKKYCNDLDDVCSGVYLLGELSNRIRDRILSFGELLSSQIISATLRTKKIPVEWKDTREIIFTDNQYGNAKVDFKVSDEKIRRWFASKDNPLSLVPGFIASSPDGSTATLGRGGSDYTAAIIAAALGAKALQIWTDVNGIMTADPRMVNNAKHIARISYQEAMELSHFGAKVIYPPTIQPVMNKDIPVHIKNTFAANEEGTVIEASATQNGNIIRGISSINKIALLSLEGSGMVGIPGSSKRLFEALANEKINVILITQGSSEHSICTGIDESAATRAKAAIDKAFVREIEMGLLNPVVVETGLAILALVGDHMKSHTGVSGKMFGALGKNGVNVRAIAQGSSERNISAVIAVTDVQKALNTLHEEFFETVYKQVNLFIVGLGNVGKKLIMQLQQQQDYLLKHLRLQANVIGIANSRKMYFDEDGIDLDNWEDLLQKGDDMKLSSFIETIQSKNLRNSIFTDVTANAEVAGTYQSLLQKSIGVVACNKIACSSAYPNYKKLKDTATEFNSSFLFETNVGAGLPVIDTLNNLLRSGDQVNKIEAVLSGTLNYVFNHYNATRKFAEVVKQAQDEGYTEPDPRLDLGGTDVMRKIMILAREAGNDPELDDIENITFMPDECMKGDVASFYKQMEKHEDHFKKLYEQATAAGSKLKFVAKYANGKAKVGLEQIPPEHDFYHLYGKDNIVLFYTNRYPEQPLVIKGAGAGAEVTASGVFADIIRASA